MSELKKEEATAHPSYDQHIAAALDEYARDVALYARLRATE